MPTDSRRLSILTAQEVDDLYGLPRFTEEDRRLYFALSPSERDLVDGVYTISVAVHLILQLGYFKAKRQFFVYAREAVTEDLEHILRRHFPAPEMADIKGLSKPTRLEQQQVILKLFGYQLCDTAAKSELEQKAKRVAMLSTQPIFILREVLQYLTNQRIVAPGYTYLQDMVGRTVSGERHIRQTIHILDFIDDLELRQSVQKALNRGEAYHRMRRAISYVNAGKFRVKTEAEQQIWNDCSRLIANAIIYYNTLLLSRVSEHKLAANDQAAIEILKGISPVAWRNVNLIGNFDFTTGSSPVDIEALAERYENPDFWRRSLQEAEDDGPAY